MYQKILVPLDGSKLAECVLPHVEALVKGCQTKSVQFVYVVEPLQHTSGGDYIISEEQAANFLAQGKAEGEKYLKKIIGGLDTLAEYGTKSGADLFVIATHGRSGVSRWVFGSVAERILRSACIPVLMVRAPGCVPGI
ncbi:MAG: universal stress protein [Deltaproteobacteria bacterium]|nr:universal stress protein [Deltaproteobacteria bacterium]